MFDGLKSLFGAAARLSVDEEINKRVSQSGGDSAGNLVLGAASKQKPRLLTTNELLKYYGNPGDPDNLTTIVPPFAMKLAWDPSKPVSKITCHKLIATPLSKVLLDIKLAYGTSAIAALGMDLFGGCLNHRPQRGLEKKYDAAIKAKNFGLAYTYLSRHAWAIATDWDPARNALKTKAPKAQFSKPEYKVMTEIFYSHGFIGYGKERNNDYMHWEIGIII